MTRNSTDKRWAQVTLILRGGREIEDTPRTPRGDAGMPLTDQEISSKFHSLADPIIGKPRANAIESMSSQFDKLSAGELAELLNLFCDPTSLDET